MTRPTFTWPDYKKAPRGTRFRHNRTGKLGTFIGPAKTGHNGGIVVWDDRPFPVRSVDGEEGHVFFVGIARDATPIRLKAWDLIGFDSSAVTVYDELAPLVGQGAVCVRIRGGRAQYEAVLYNDSNPGEKVKLARLETGSGGIREISRYVDADTELELVAQVPTTGTSSPD